MDILFNAACSLTGSTSFDQNFLMMYTRGGIRARLSKWKLLFEEFIDTSRENPMLSLALRMYQAEVLFGFRIKASEIPQQLVIKTSLSLDHS